MHNKGKTAKKNILTSKSGAQCSFTSHNTQQAMNNKAV